MHDVVRFRCDTGGGDRCRGWWPTFRCPWRELVPCRGHNIDRGGEIVEPPTFRNVEESETLHLRPSGVDEFEVSPDKLAARGVEAPFLGDGNAGALPGFLGADDGIRPLDQIIAGFVADGCGWDGAKLDAPIEIWVNIAGKPDP